MDSFGCWIRLRNRSSISSMKSLARKAEQNEALNSSHVWMFLRSAVHQLLAEPFNTDDIVARISASGVGLNSKNSLHSSI